ncbi:MAG TPA: hypothetical protein VFV93_11330 [Thermomicrobiales bacterium]|nr:hypothetical protein [Thermomicrobiales bacterium]
MPTLAIRPLNPLDIPAMRHVCQRRDRLDMPDAVDPAEPDLANQILATLPANVRQGRVVVALVDGELCAYMVFRPQASRFRWDLLAVAAGSPRLDATDDVCFELWSALLEYAIRQAGEQGAKRLFATVREDCAAYDSLRATGFERYARFMILAGTRQSGPVALPEGMREQEDSDVWSIHQLYHHVTPRAVQFAEALTSSVWELPQRSLFDRLTGMPQRTKRFVLDTTNGVQAYCAIQVRRGGAMARLMISHEYGAQAASFVLAAAAEAGVAPASRLRILVPGYTGELVSGFVEAGFEMEDERTAMVRHTTAPAVVHAKLAPIPADAGERVPRGIPTYVRNARRAIPEQGARNPCA